MFINLINVKIISKKMGFNKKVVLCSLVLVFVLVFCVNFTSATIGANFTNITGGIERAQSSISSTNLINFSVGARSENITRIQFIITGSMTEDPDKFITDSNGSSASGSFANSTTDGSGSRVVILTYTNLGPYSLIPNGTTKNFWFNINSRSMSAAMLSVMVNASGVSGDSNASSTYSWPFTFRFSGYVKNESGGYQNGTNVSIYRWQEGQNGPPTETLMGSTLSNENGAFTLSGLSSAGGVLYKLKMIYYNQTDSSQALKIGTILPQFPSEMYYPQEFHGNYEFMRPPSLNGTTFYLGSAATINITANNGTTAQRFGYMLMEQSTGFMIESNSMANVTNAKIVVPTGRTYTLMLIRANSAFRQIGGCNGRFMNDSACPTPPKSNSTISPSTDGQVINVDMDMTISRVQSYGCIGVEGNSSTITNISVILPRMTPWTGFVPPARPDVQDINLTNTGQLNYSDSRCLGKIAWYNISLLNANYLMEFYGRNDTSARGGEFVGAFQNVSFGGQSSGTNNNVNITLGRMAGNFRAATTSEMLMGTGTNTSKFAIRIQNSTGGAITQDTPNVELHVRNNVFGEMTYIIEEMTNGTFYLALPLNSTVKAKIFSNNAPPKEKVVNLSLGELNITLTTLSGGDAGFRRKNASGQLEMANISDDSFGINMSFIRASASCNVISPDSSCYLTTSLARNFNPLAALVAGKINMKMSLPSTGISITFYNFDMFAAKQPPMESVLNNQSSGGGASTPVWEFGSFVPADVYDYAVVGIPYSDADINDSAPVNMSVAQLYDENWNAVWNYSAGDRPSSLSASVDDYLGNANNRSYNSTGYRDLLNGGIVCNATNSSVASAVAGTYCYIDTSSNIIYMRVPHFSGVAPSVTGSAPSSASSSSSNLNSGAGSGGVTATYSTYSYEEKEFGEYGQIDKALATNDKIKLTIGGEAHSVQISSLTSDSIIVNISSTPQQATLSIGESKKFEVSGDNYYDILVRLNGITNSKANVTLSSLHELISGGVATTANESVGTTESISANTVAAGENSWTSGRIIFILAAIVVIIVAFFAFRMYRERKWYGKY